MNIHLQTAIIGGIDAPKAIPFQLLIDDQTLSINYYTDDFVPEEYRTLPERTQALYFKTQMLAMHPRRSHCIWVDSKVQIDRVDFVQQCIESIHWDEDEIAILRHGERDCAYDELNYIIQQTEANVPYFAMRYKKRLPVLKYQLEVLEHMNFPKHNGLGDCSIFIVNNCRTMRNVMDAWWELCKQDYFDQVAIQHICWQAGIKIQYIDFEPKSFHLVKHLKIK